MPIVEHTPGELALKCANHHGTQLTMQELEVGAFIQTKKTPPQVLPGQIPVRIFVCQECGYLEMYAVGVVGERVG